MTPYTDVPLAVYAVGDTLSEEYTVLLDLTVTLVLFTSVTQGLATHHQHVTWLYTENILPHNKHIHAYCVKIILVSPMLSHNIIRVVNLCFDVVSAVVMLHVVDDVVSGVK